MSILVAGGAGYIGSHTVKELLDSGADVVTVDSLITGHKEDILGGKFYQGDIRDKDFLREVFRKEDIEEVIHFAAFSLVGQSMSEPIMYYDNNLRGTWTLLEAMCEAGAKRIVFSSTAAVYGEPENTPILESDKTEPTNAYGQTKLAVEGLLKWVSNAHGINYTALRYFNAAGAHESGLLGEKHDPETHLIPIVLQVAAGEREGISVFGEDYPTPDGTCVRDYIHVSDLAEAHIKALTKMRETGENATYNLGNGKGFSVKEVIETARKVTRREIREIKAPRREGDPAILIASSEKATRELGLTPRYADLEKIISTAWEALTTKPKKVEMCL